MSPYTEERRTTLTGSTSLRIRSIGMPSLRIASTLVKTFVLLIVTFAGMHAEAFWKEPVFTPPLPEYVAMTGIGSASSSIAPVSSVASSESIVSSLSSSVPWVRMTREERIVARKEALKNRPVLHSAAPTRLQPTVLNQRGVYLGAVNVARAEFLDGTLQSLKETAGSAVIFDVKGGGVLYRSGAPMAMDLSLVRSIYDLPAVIEKLHAQGFEVIGRFVAIKDEAFTLKRPDTRVKHPVTGRVLNQTWIDPSNDDAIAFNMQVICELAAAGMDEINLDYIRFSTAEVGALSVLSGEEKADRVEKFIRAARDTIDRCGPKTRLGLSTYAILGWQYDANVETLGQDVVRFAPFVDVISPMAYPATFAVGAYYNPAKHPRSRMYYLVYRTLEGYKELLGPEHSWKIRPWIQGYGVTTKNMADQIDAVYDAGSCGFLVWNAMNNYSPTYAAMGIQVPPSHCAKGEDVVQG